MNRNTATKIQVQTRKDLPAIEDMPRAERAARLIGLVLFRLGVRTLALLTVVALVFILARLVFPGLDAISTVVGTIALVVLFVALGMVASALVLAFFAKMHRRANSAKA